MRSSFFFSVSITILLLPTVSAAASPVVITEISPVWSATHEWVEVQNISTLAIDLTKWKFWEANVNHTLKVFQGSAVLTASSTAIIAEDAATFLVDHPTSTLAVFDSSWSSLADTGEEIGIRDASGTLVEDIIYPDTQGAVIERVDVWSDAANAIWCEEPIATPGVANSCPLPQPVPTDTVDTTTASMSTGTPALVLSEIFPAPASGGEEWIEVWNAGDGTALAGTCTLSDAKNPIATFSTDISAHTFTTAILSSAKLNNSGDTVSLFCDGALVDSLTYGTPTLSAPDTDEAIARTSLPDGVWELTTTDTQDADNVITAPPTTAAPTTKNGQHTTTRSYAVGRILINEIFPGDTQTGWIELANPETHAVDLDDWKLLVNTDTPVALHGTLPGNGHMVIDHLASAIDGTRGIAFLIDPEGYTSEEVRWGAGDGTTEDNAPAATQPGTSIARAFDAYTSGNAGADFVETGTPTPREQNTITALFEDAPPLVLSEILPDPAGPDATAEFIEIENRSSSTVSTVGWHVAIGTRHPQSLPAHDIPPHGVLAFFRSDTHLALPNSGATLTFFTPRGRIADARVYDAADAGVAFALEDNTWAWTTTPTPNLPNTISKPNHPPHPIIRVTDPESPGEPFRFDAADAWDEDGPLTHIFWDMGDGTTSTATTTVHTFATTGHHRITLTVADEAGITASTTRSIVVAKNDLDDTHDSTAADTHVTLPHPRVLGAQTTRRVVRKMRTKKVATPVLHVHGTLLVEPGVLGTRIVAVRTPNESLLVEIPKQQQHMRRGDTLDIYGTEKHRSGKTVLAATTITSTHGDIPEPTIIADLEDASTLSPYSLVRVQGTVLEQRAGKLRIENQGELAVALPKHFAAGGNSLVDADISITGIVRTTPTGEQEVVARDANDVSVLHAPPAKQQEHTTPISPASAGMTGAMGGMLLTSSWSARAMMRRRAAAALALLRRRIAI